MVSFSIHNTILTAKEVMAQYRCEGVRGDVLSWEKWGWTLSGDVREVEVQLPCGLSRYHKM